MATNDLADPLVQPSYWLATASQQGGFPTLERDIAVDVAVVGGGLVGITAALLLKRAGLTVAVLEARRVAAQATGCATAAVTSLYGPGYAQLADRFGDATAQLYGESQQAGLHTVEQLVRQLGIDCDFERVPAYAYAQSDSALQGLRQAAETAQRLGLPAAFVGRTGAPLAPFGALRFADQAQLHPVKYVQALAAAVAGGGGGGQVFEHTRVQDVTESEGRCLVRTERAVVTARHAIVATGLPFLDRGGYFAEAFPRTRVALAARLPSAAAGAQALPDGIWVAFDEPAFSVRTARDAGGRLAICQGRPVKTAHVPTRTLRAELEAWAREQLGADAVERVWTNQDFISMDGLPFVGHLTRGSQHVWVATGLGDSGMAGGTAAAMVLADRVRDKPNPWVEVYDSTRIHAAAGFKRFLAENVDVAREWVQDHLSGAPALQPGELAPGHAAVVSGESGKIAAYRDESGALHAVSATCTHMGCTVAWNDVARSWDCPCHGSRFDVAGQVLSGPAVKPLAAVQWAAPQPDAAGSRADTYRAMVDPEAASFETPDAATMNPEAARPRHPVPVRDMPRPDTYRAMVDPEAASFETPDAATMNPLAALPRHAAPVRDIPKASEAGSEAVASKGMPFKAPGVKPSDSDRPEVRPAAQSPVSAAVGGQPAVPQPSTERPSASPPAASPPAASPPMGLPSEQSNPAASDRPLNVPVRPAISGPYTAHDASPGSGATPWVLLGLAVLGAAAYAARSTPIGLRGVPAELRMPLERGRRHLARGWELAALQVKVAALQRRLHTLKRRARSNGF